MSIDQKRIILQLAQELGSNQSQIKAAVDLLDEGSTVPFIARYRKEATGGLDDSILRSLQERLIYLRELEDRRISILESIENQGQLTPELKTAIEQAENKQTLEDLYLPYKPKRRTRAQIAREAGLQKLADEIYQNKLAIPEEFAAKFLNPEYQINNIKNALDGARDILAEQFSENAALLALLRSRLNKEAAIRSTVIPEKVSEAIKFKDYFNHQELLATLAPHRMLAMLRGREQGFLNLTVDLPEVWGSETPRASHPFISEIARLHHIERDDSPRSTFLNETCRWTWKVKLAGILESEVISAIRDSAQTEAISVFGKNLKDLLLSAPAGGKPTMGLDPGIRTGVKVAVIDSTGQVLEHATIYPHEPRRQWNESITLLASLCMKHKVELIAIGNGTASRETDQLAAELLAQHKELKAIRVMVSEAGASIYSASALASAELPDLDVSIRGAVSIARRLQDPLAELVKIDPKSIGVGQYQHDVDQRQLSARLDAVVEDCVNAVGVEVNTASEQLLSRVSGLNASVAKSLVTFRNNNGKFKCREDLRKVPRLGDKTFEQAAGFLRIQGAKNPLDNSSVHPEAYKIVQSIAAKTNKPIDNLIGNRTLLKGLNPVEFVNDQFGLLTVQDILLELEKPGRDPRPSFKTAQFNDKIHTIADLKPGMTLEGVVTNVANFGAFVDIGVHQDGLVHLSALSNAFVKDPHSLVKTGQIVKVKVMEVDIPRKRISLSMRLTDDPSRISQEKNSSSKTQNSHLMKSSQNIISNNSFATAYAKAQKNKF
jgi:uncharacterized protein